MTPIWLTSTIFAQLAGISDRKARAPLAAIACGQRVEWRGAKLMVRTKRGRGGSGGVRYEVNASSLPPDLQARLKASRQGVDRLSSTVPALTNAALERGWWEHLLAPALEHPKGSEARKQALDVIAGATHYMPDGRRKSISLRTLQRKLLAIETDGNAARSGRSDRGRKRVVVSRAWDKAVPFDAATRERIAHELKQEIRGLLKGGASWGHTLVLARNKLATLTKVEGFSPADPTVMERICVVPNAMVSAELHFRKVHQFKRDRKAYEDSKPRIRRSSSGLRPMELVVADVHPIDVHMVRADGSVATPRLIGFMDWATQRVWAELVFFDARGGVRNVDMIEAFGAMAEHPAFGLPENIYFDNGNENLFADYLDDAMQLMLPSFHGEDRKSRVIKALPYNASAKPIERWFGDFEKRYLSTLPGWIGGDRMKKKQAAVGRTVAPFGAFEDFIPAFYGMLQAYEHMPQGRASALKGLSPAAAFRRHVEAAWAATVMSRDEIRAACAKTETRKVIQGTISVHGRLWTCEELWSYPHEQVGVRVPAYHEPAELLLLGPDGRRLGIAVPDQAYSPLDARGAQATAVRANAHRKAVRALDSAAPSIPVAGRLIALGRVHTAVVPNSPAGTVSYDPAMSPARSTMPQSRAAQEREAGQREADEVLALRLKLASKAG